MFHLPDISMCSYSYQDNIYLRTLGSYIEALGGQLEVGAVFPDETVVLVLPGAGRASVRES
jgi:hypothetical protein